MFYSIPHIVAQLYLPFVATLSTDARKVIFSQADDLLRVMTLADASVTTIAGQASVQGNVDGIGSNAVFHFPFGIAVDNIDNIIVCDRDSNVIRHVVALGSQYSVTTIAGRAYAGNRVYADGMGTFALFSGPESVTYDTDGDTMIIADRYNNRLRAMRRSLNSVIESVESSRYNNVIVTTIAGNPCRLPGNGCSSLNFNDGVGTNIVVYPYNVAMDYRGNAIFTEVSIYINIANGYDEPCK